MLNVLSAAEKYGRRDGSLWRFDDLGLSLFASEVLRLQEAERMSVKEAEKKLDKVIEDKNDSINRGMFLYIENPHP